MRPDAAVRVVVGPAIVVLWAAAASGVAQASAIVPDVSGTWVDDKGRVLVCRQLQEGGSAVAEVVCRSAGDAGAGMAITGRLRGLDERGDEGTAVLDGAYSQPGAPNPAHRRGRVRLVFEYKWAGLDATGTRAPDYVGRTWSGEWWDAEGRSGGAWSGRRRAAFSITAVSLPSQVTMNGPRAALRVSWDGEPAFPVELVYAPDSCQPGLNCVTARARFTTNTNPLVFDGAVWCAGRMTSGIYFDYSVRLTDAGGVTTAPKKATFTCSPR